MKINEIISEGIIDTVKKVFTPEPKKNVVQDVRDKVQAGELKDAGKSSVFQQMSDRNKQMKQAIDASTDESASFPFAGAKVGQKAGVAGQLKGKDPKGYPKGKLVGGSA